MKLLAIDPSSTCTGYAFWSDQTLTDIGRITPTRSKDTYLLRIDSIVAELVELLAEAEPDKVVLEVPSGRPGRGSEAGGRGRLAVYGLAVGAIRQAVIAHLSPEQLTSVDERVAPSYDRRKDPGADVADAINLGLWWLSEQGIQQ